MLRVESIADLFSMAETLGKQPRPRGPRLAIVTNALIAVGGSRAPLSGETRRALDHLLPVQWSHGSPIDILGDPGPLRFVDSITIAYQDATSDGILAIVTLQAMTDSMATAERVAALAHSGGKPVLARRSTAYDPRRRL